VPRSSGRVGSIRALATELGISYEAARSRLRRQRSPRSRPHPHPQPTAADRTADDVIAQLRAEVTYLRTTLDRELERAAVERAELRRLLAAEQQRRLPAPVDTVVSQPETAENAPHAPESASAAPRPFWAFWRR
jgi:hypothetical protein